MYQCPNCSANIKFNIARQMLYCDHCETELDPASFYKEKDAEEFDTIAVTILRCPQCGGDIISDDNEAAVFCSYCGGSTILDSRIEETKRPAYIIPFKKTKEECVASYKRRIRRNIFAAPAMREAKNIDSFRGIYMPYWNYEFKGQEDMSVDGTKSYSRGNYTYTEHHQITANITYHFDGLQHDAASSFADYLSEAIAPFSMKEKVPFTTSYLSGFYADVYDVGVNAYLEDMQVIAAGSLCDNMRQNHVFDNFSVDTAKATRGLHPHCASSELTMLPVWFMGVRMKEKGQDRMAYAVMNGQTGRVSGDIPISVPRYLSISLLFSGALFLLMNYGINLVYSPGFLGVITSILSFIMGITHHIREGKIAKRDRGEDDKGMQLRLNIYQEKTDKEKMPKKKKKFFEHTFMWVPGAALVVFFMSDVIHDYYYYGVIIVGLVLILRMILMDIRHFNLLCTHKLPQFDRKGGDDRV